MGREVSGASAPEALTCNRPGTEPGWFDLYGGKLYDVEALTGRYCHLDPLGTKSIDVFIVERAKGKFKYCRIGIYWYNTIRII